MAQTAGQDRMLTQGMDLGFSVSHSARDAYSNSKGSDNKEVVTKFSPNLKKYFFFVFNIRMSLRPIVYQDRPEDEPETAESPKHVEY